MNETLRPGVRPRELWGWAMFDFANSGFTTVVITALFNVYFVSLVAAGAPWATFAWTAALAVSYALIGAFAELTSAYFIVGLALLTGVDAARRTRMRRLR